MVTYMSWSEVMFFLIEDLKFGGKDCHDYSLSFLLLLMVQKSCDHQLRLVVSPIIYKVLSRWWFQIFVIFTDFYPCLGFHDPI